MLRSFGSYHLYFSPYFSLHLLAEMIWSPCLTSSVMIEGWLMMLHLLADLDWSCPAFLEGQLSFRLDEQTICLYFFIRKSSKSLFDIENLTPKS